MELLPGEKRGYWKYHAPEKWFRQAKIRGKSENRPAVLLLDSGAEVSIVDTAFAREVGCPIDTSRTQECVGIQDETYYTVGRARPKVTLAGNLVYFFEAWVGDLVGQTAILGMDFMVPAGIRLDAGDGTVCLPDEVRVRMLGRRPLYGAGAHLITPTSPLRIEAYQDRDVRLRYDARTQRVLWLTRGKTWVTTLVNGRSSKPAYVRVTNLSDTPLTLDTHVKLGMWTAKDQLPREYGFVRTGSRRYQEWQNLVYGVAVESGGSPERADTAPMTEQRQYDPPKAILQRKGLPVEASVMAVRSSCATGTERVEEKFKEAKGNDQRLGGNVKGETVEGSPKRAGQDQVEVGESTVRSSQDRNGHVLAVRSSSSQVEPKTVVTPATTGCSTDGTPTQATPVYTLRPEAAESTDQPGQDRDEPVLAVRSGPKSDPSTLRPEAADDEVFYHEGSDLFAEDMERDMAILPEVSLTAEVAIGDIKVGRPGSASDEEGAKQEDRLRQIIWKRRKLLIGKGNALPPAAIGVVCDIDVGDAKPIAQRVRKIQPRFREKVSELLKGLLSAGMIQPSTSPWASPIVVIVKKNGVDIRLCIDYRLVNGLTQLMVYPMPLINDLLEDLEPYLWYCSLDMASDFWVVPMTDRARLISAFITPFGLFEWLRMPFGLKNAPQIYQRLVDNALYGFRRIPKVEGQDVFAAGDADDASRPSVLGRRSYIDDILIGGKTWDDLCEKVEKLLDACERWNLSISVEKSYWGMGKADYLGHAVSHHGLTAQPKNLEALAGLAFPQTLKGLQSFLGSLNYYHRFMDNFAVYATVLYTLTEDDFIARRKRPRSDRTGLDEADEKWNHAVAAFEELKMKVAKTPILRHFDPERESVVILYANDWAVAAVLTQPHDGIYMPVKFVSRTLKPNELKYDPMEKEILSLLLVLDECFTMLTGREIRVLSRRTTLAWLFRSNNLQGRLSQWTARLSPWSLKIEKSDRGEADILGAIAASITPRDQVDAALKAIAPRRRAAKIVTIPVPRLLSGEDLHVLSFDGSAKSKREGGAFGAIIWKLPGWEVVKAASGYDTDLTVNEAEYRGLLLGCELLRDVKVKRLVVCGDSNLVIRQIREEMDCKSPGLVLLRGRAWRALTEWPEREYFHVRRDWNASADLLAGQALQSQAGLLIHDVNDLEDLQTLNRLPEIIRPTLHEMEARPEPDRTAVEVRSIPTDSVSAGKQTTFAARPRPDKSVVKNGSIHTRPPPGGTQVDPVALRDPDRTGCETSPAAIALSPTTARITPVVTRGGAIRATSQAGSPPTVLQERVVQQLRLERIRTAQDEERWIANLKQYLRGDVDSLSRREAKNCSKLAYQYEEGDEGLLYYHSRGDENAEDRSTILKLVVPETQQGDVLHHFHASLEGARQGIGRTYQRVRQHFHWPGLYKSVQRHVGECVGCETGKGRPTIRGASPGNILATYPFQVIAMDHIPSLPASFKGNTELLVWVDLFTGFVVVKANASRSAETVAEAYEEAVFRRFGASEAIRHDREPGFMSDFFRAFNRLMGQRQRATMAYRPQANGAAERMVQTVTRAIKMYIADVGQRDWDEYAERLTLALNTAQDRTRGETPFFLVHGWDPRTTLEAALAVGNTRRHDVDARRWQMGIQRHYKRARAQAAEMIRAAVEERAALHNESVHEHNIEAGSQIWLYLDRVKSGYAKKLAHLWHGPFRVEEMLNSFTAKLETRGTEYSLYPIVHVSKLKLVRQFPSRPHLELTVRPGERFDFDEQLLPEDSWEAEELGEGVFDVERIVDVREGRATRYGRVQRDYQVKRKDRVGLEWVPESDLNCGGLMHDFMRERAGRNRFQVIQSHEEDETARPVLEN